MNRIVIDEIFVRFTLAYRNLFSFDKQNDFFLYAKEFDNALSDILDDLIRDAASEWIANNKFPPKISEFREMCLSKQRLYRDKMDERHRAQQKQIEQQKKPWTQEDTDRIREIIAKAKKGLCVDEDIKFEPKTWPKEQVTVHHKMYNAQAYQARKSYLMGLSEKQAYFLQTEDKYDRIKYIREDMGMRQYENYKSNAPPGPVNGEKIYTNSKGSFKRKYAGFSD